MSPSRLKPRCDDADLTDVQLTFKRLSDLTDEDIDAWADLAGRAVEPNPFFEPSFARAAASHLGPKHVGVLTVRNASGQWQAAAPARVIGYGPFKALDIWQHRYCFSGTPLVATDRPAAVARIVDLLAQDRVGLMRLRDVCSSGPIARALAEGLIARSCTTITRERQSRAALTRANLDGFPLSGRQRAELRRRRRRLQEALGGELAVTDRSGDPDAWRQFLSLEASGWKGRAGTALASQAGDQAFFLEIAKHYAARGRLQVLSLGTADRVAAMCCNISAGNTLFGFKIAFDEELRKFGPGIMLLAESVELFRSHRCEDVLDSCAAPDNAHLNKLLPERIALETIVARSPGLRGSLATGMSRLLQGPLRTRVATAVTGPAGTAATLDAPLWHTAASPLGL